MAPESRESEPRGQSTGKDSTPKAKRRSSPPRPPTISEIEPADSDEDERPRRSRAAGTRKDNHGLRRDNEKEEQESKGWSLPSSPELLMLFCSILICVVAAKYLENLPMLKDRRVFTKEELARYDGSQGGPIYLAFAGQVFDVTKGRKYYGEGGGYQFFVGKDATRAFISGEFEKDLTDDITDFTPEEYKGLVEWRDFYHKDYKYVGKLEGAFYDSSGEPKEALRILEEGAVQGKRIAQLRKQERTKHPNCNSRWSQSRGGEVWCNDGNYPRRVMEPSPGTKPKSRCACFKEMGWSDLRQLYPGCKPDSSRCKTSPARQDNSARARSAQVGKVDASEEKLHKASAVSDEL